MRHLFLLSLLLLASLSCVHSAQEPSGAVDIAEIRSAAEQGDANARRRLGVLYDNGHGVAQDYVEARKFYLLAAEQGYASAQYNLGVLYSSGQGVPQDYVEARKFYLLAAEQGDSSAQYNLGVLHYLGQGVAQDYTTAYVWSNLAAAQGNAAANNNLEIVAAKLDSASLAEAQKLARKYFKLYVEPFQ